jgi:hypothetical protein
MKSFDKHNITGSISDDEFRELVRVHDAHCITIYLPIERAGQKADQNHARIRLKNCLKEIRSKLETVGLNKDKKNNYLEPVDNLQEDVHFWRYQSDGLAIFLHGQNLSFYTLPIRFKEQTYLSDHFYLLPVIPFFNDNGKYLLLLLSRQSVRLFEGSRDFITEITIQDLVPGKLEDVVGYDYREKSLQHRSGQGGEAGAMFHGQGSGKDDREVELKKFFRAVDTGLMKILKKEDAPLIVACVEEYYPLYREITEYKNLFEVHLSGNPENEDPLWLHEESWNLVKEYFRGERRSKVEQIQDKSARGRTSWEAEEIIPASIDGRVDTLFIQKGTDMYGIYDDMERRVIVGHPDRIREVSLFNMAAIHTIRNRGRVFLAPPGEMPLKETQINALLRY